MPKKGHKSQAGVGDLYEVPKVRINLSITEEAKNLLAHRASAMGISSSEFVERSARGNIQLTTQAKENEKLITINQIINKWVEACPPERRKLARWVKTWQLIEELLAVLKQS